MIMYLAKSLVYCIFTITFLSQYPRLKKILSTNSLTQLKQFLNSLEPWSDNTKQFICKIKIKVATY